MAYLYPLFLDPVGAPEQPVEPHRLALAQRLYTLTFQRLLSGATDAKVIKPHCHHALNIIDVSAVEDKRSLHQFAQFFHVEQLKLTPFSDNDQRVRLFAV